MKTYQKQLLAALRKANWDLSTVHEGKDWWEREYWVISSKQKPMELWLSFIGSDAEDYKKVFVDDIWASKGRPVSRLRHECEAVIVVLKMSSGSFEENLSVFVDAINAYRETGSQHCESGA